ncbi:MAG: sigma-70 family RNA polymerase sigma factor [Tannerella sp.]|jgi:RNA polymerase sigma factor (sigma-70 family)|nr:sigma-70 family RNA polymerase sigma factor [Tannerella sp.]
MTQEELKYYFGLTDKQLQEAIYSGDKKAEIYLFFVKCAPVIEYQTRRFFKGEQMQLDEAIHELYIYLKKDDWKKLRQYEGRNNASIKTWMSTIARNFFLDLHNRRIPPEIPIDDVKPLWSSREDREDREISERNRMIVNKTLLAMPNERYRNILIKLYFEGKTCKELAIEMGVSQDYFYVLSGRAEKQFREYYVMTITKKI